MVRAGDDSTPNEAASDPSARLSTAQVGALVGYYPGTVRKAAESGEITGSTKDSGGRWWHD